MSTAISWTNETLNLLTGCTKCSAGCANCYAECQINTHAPVGHNEQ